ncbi:ankyrin repeat and SOCS box protein 18 [Apteryx rowi]|uniref:ankyrin repeat and SOCS box protein 18 n=1 Tax=Apteryx rowi TaxID=308060 RepID=UPI000E1C7074|nr:ankyrin repeat and SOCS box protein 18 [Apteryx rowi]
MGELPGGAPEKLRFRPKAEPEGPPAARAPAGRYYAALLAGDLRSLQVLTDRYHQDVNLVFELGQEELEWQAKSRASYGLSGLWSLEYKRELSTPLCIAAGRGHAGCLRHLLRRRAAPDLAPGGRGALHEACRGGHAACAALLLEHRADPQLRGADGRAPLHLCAAPATLGCAKLLVQHGAAVNLPAEDTGDTALHVAARHCLYEHAQLYLARGAGVDRRNAQDETPLSVLCGQAPRDEDGCLQLCRLLVRHGADVEARDEARRGPLHKACGQANHRVVRFLLRRGADVNALDYDGLSPLGCVLRAAACKRELQPHLCVQVLLNHGSQKIWPGAFEKVLKSCAAVPEIIEILFNSYSQIPVAEKWAEAVPEEVFQQHLTFYESLFRLSGTARCLQHLCRFAIRKQLGSKCHRLVALLPVPKSLHGYLLLEPQGAVL